MKKITLIAILACSALPAAAADYDPAAEAAKIAPFLDENTVCVIRVNFRRFDNEAFWKRLEELLGVLGEGSKKELDRSKADMGAWVKAFLDAGGQNLYMIGTLSDLLRTPFFFVVVPLSPKADVEAIRGLFVDIATDPPATMRAGRRPRRLFLLPQARRIGSAIVAGRLGQLDRIAVGAAFERPELVKVMAVAGDATFQILVLPPSHAQRVIEELMPRLPRQLGGGPTTALTRGIKWISLAVDAPPKMALRITIQSQDAESAKTLKNVLAVIAQNAGRKIPGVEKIVAMLTPSEAGDQLRLTMNDKQIRQFLGEFFAPMLGRRAKLAASARNMRSIVLAVRSHVDSDGDGEFPESLEALVKAGSINAKLLVNPRQPDRSPGYVYVRPTMRSKDLRLPMETVILYEAYDKWSDGINTVFADSHVEFMADEAKFKKLLAETQRLNAKSAPGAGRP